MDLKAFTEWTKTIGINIDELANRFRSETAPMQQTIGDTYSITALQWTGDNLAEVKAFLGDRYLDRIIQEHYPKSDDICFVAADGNSRSVKLHWYIVKREGDLFSACDPTSFAARYRSISYVAPPKVFEEWEEGDKIGVLGLGIGTIRYIDRVHGYVEFDSPRDRKSVPHAEIMWISRP